MGSGVLHKCESSMAQKIKTNQKAKSTKRNKPSSPGPGKDKKRQKGASNREKVKKITPEGAVVLQPSVDEIRHNRLIKAASNLIDKGRVQTLERLISKLRPFDISYIGEFLDEDQKSIFFSLIPNEEMAEILPEMSRESRTSFIQNRDPSWLAEIVDIMDSDDAADVLGEMSREKSSFILKKINQKDATIIKDLLKYEETSAGGIMATELLAVSESATISEVVAEFKKLAEKEDIGDIHSTYVIDENGKLLGSIPVRKLVLYGSNIRVTQIMETNLISVKVTDDQEEVASLFRRHNLITIPVVNEGFELLGRITIDDIVDVIEEETSEDIYRMAGVGIESSVHSTIRGNISKRLPWLLVNLATAAVSALVVSMYESTIDRVAILAAFMPMVAGLGGNAGSQVIAIVVRSLALGELTYANAGKVLAREIATGLFNGLFLGLVIGSVTFLATGKPYLGIVISWAMVMNVFTASIAGLLVPLGLKRMGVDPAVASNIFVTPMTDTLGFFFFLGLAKIFIDHLV